MFPLFLYLSTVMIHSPTPEMFFYRCPNQGQVIGFSVDSNDIKWYEVEFDCPLLIRGSVHRTFQVNEAKLQSVGK